jgi:hypothetical protein
MVQQESNDTDAEDDSGSPGPSKLRDSNTGQLVSDPARDTDHRHLLAGRQRPALRHRADSPGTGADASAGGAEGLSPEDARIRRGERRGQADVDQRRDGGGPQGRAPQKGTLLGRVADGAVQAFDRQFGGGLAAPNTATGTQRTLPARFADDIIQGAL